MPGLTFYLLATDSFAYLFPTLNLSCELGGDSLPLHQLFPLRLAKPIPARIALVTSLLAAAPPPRLRSIAPRVWRRRKAAAKLAHYFSERDSPRAR